MASFTYFCMHSIELSTLYAKNCLLANKNNVGFKYPTLGHLLYFLK